MGKRIRLERRRQIALGYTHEHDLEVGQAHLIGWAFRYFLRGKFVKGASLIVAAREARTYMFEWQATSEHYVLYNIYARTAEEVEKKFKKIYGEVPVTIWKVMR